MKFIVSIAPTAATKLQISYLKNYHNKIFKLWLVHHIIPSGQSF